MTTTAEKMTRLEPEILSEIIETLTRFCDENFDRETRLDYDRRDHFPEAMIRRMLSPEIGLHLLFLPEAYGGFGGGAYDIYRVSEAMAKIDLGLATAFLAISLGTDPLRVGGTDSQKERWMTRIAEEGLIVAYGATEPSAGSDLGSFKTKAEPLTDESGNTVAYRLNGVKQFITNGGVADLYSILAMTPGGPSFFMVERNTPGLSAGKPEEKHGIRISNTSQVLLDDVEVPADHLVGLKEGLGMAQAVAVFGYTRLMVAAFGLGGGVSALEKAIQYSRERRQFGKRLIDLQGFSHKLIVPAWVRLEAARAYIEHVADRLDSGESGLEVEGAIAKLFATETGNWAAEQSIQALGGYGYTHEYEIEKIKRDVRITMIYEGTSEILQQTIAKDRWRRHLQSRGRYFHDFAGSLTADCAGDAQCGATTVAVAARVLGNAMEQMRIRRLTRAQAVMFHLADMVTMVEVGAAMSRRAHQAQQTQGSASRTRHLQDAAHIFAIDVARRVRDGIQMCLEGYTVEADRGSTGSTQPAGFDRLDTVYGGYGAAMDRLANHFAQEE